MVSETTIIVSIIGAVFASTGFWAFLTAMIQRRDRKESAEAQMLKGLGHDRICYLGSCYMQQGTSRRTITKTFMTTCLSLTRSSAATVQQKK